MKRVGLLITNNVTPATLCCPHCGKEYKSEKGLADHCKKEHPDAFANEP